LELEVVVQAELQRLRAVGEVLGGKMEVPEILVCQEITVVDTSWVKPQVPLLVKALLELFGPEQQSSSHQPMLLNIREIQIK
jgi:hypothetical protein